MANEKSCVLPWAVALLAGAAFAYVGISPTVYRKVHAFETRVKAKYLPPRKKGRR